MFATGTESLRSLARLGRFDAELAAQLARFELRVPPLAERLGDLPEIAQALAARVGAGLGRAGARLSTEAVTHLSGEMRPGSLRQLERLIERAVAFSPNRVLDRATLRALHEESTLSVEGLRRQRAVSERESLIEALEATGGNITQVAERLGKSRPTVYRLIEKHRIPLAHPSGQRRSPW